MFERTNTIKQHEQFIQLNTLRELLTTYLYVLEESVPRSEYINLLTQILDKPEKVKNTYAQKIVKLLKKPSLFCPKMAQDFQASVIHCLKGDLQVIIESSIRSDNAKVGLR